MPDQSIRLLTPAPFSLKSIALSHGWHECAPFSWSEGGRCLQYVARRGREAFRIAITQGGARRGRVELAVRVMDVALSNEELQQVEADVRHMLRLDEDYSEFHALCRQHDHLRPVEMVGAGRLLRSPTLYEDTIKTICGTNVNWTQAVKMVNRVAQLGPCVPNFRHLNAWPTPTEILKAGEAYLTDVCRLGYRSASILRLCADVRARKLDLDAIRLAAADPAVDSAAVVALLRRIHGVGEASAHFLLATLGRYDLLGIDSWTLTYVGRVHFGGRKPTPRQVRKVYEPFGRYQHLAWWCEQWLTWGTAREILHEHGLPPMGEPMF